MAAFEFTFLVSDLEELKKIEKLMSGYEGKKTKEVLWGKRDLAYPINKIVHAEYVTWEIEMSPSQVTHFRLKLNFEKTPMRYLILKKEDN